MNMFIKVLYSLAVLLVICRVPVKSGIIRTSTESSMYSTENRSITSTPTTPILNPDLEPFDADVPPTTTKEDSFTPTKISQQVECRKSGDQDEYNWNKSLCRSILWFIGTILSTIVTLVVVVRRFCSKSSKSPVVPLDVASKNVVGISTDPKMVPAAHEFDVEGGPTAPKKFDKNSQEIRLKHQKYMRTMKKQEADDMDSTKYKKCGPIFIPAMIDDAQFAKKCEDPDNIILQNVVYDSTQNELYDIGSDVDDIELNPSSILTISEDSQSEEFEKKPRSSKKPTKKPGKSKKSPSSAPAKV